MSTVTLKAITVLPPDMLGVTLVIVPLGTTVSVSKEMLTNSTLPYNNINDHPIGSVKIIGSSGDYRQALAPSDVAGITITRTMNNTLRMSKTSSTSAISNDIVTNANMNSNYLKFYGSKLGEVEVYYVAKSVLSSESTTESDSFSSVQGTIRVKVVATNNLPATNIDNSQDNYVLGTLKTLYMDLFSVGYSDPENDPIGKVKITSLPTQGLLYFNTIPVVVNQIINASDISTGLLVFEGPSNGTAGQEYTFNFEVADSGNGTFIST